MQAAQSIEISWVDDTDSEEESDYGHDEQEEFIETRRCFGMRRKVRSKHAEFFEKEVVPRELEEASSNANYSSTYSAGGICNPKMKTLLEKGRLRNSPYYDGRNLPQDDANSQTSGATMAAMAAFLLRSRAASELKPEHEKVQDRSGLTLDTTRSESDHEDFARSSSFAADRDRSYLSSCSPTFSPGGEGTEEGWTRALSLLELEDQDNEPILEHTGLCSSQDELLPDVPYLHISPLPSFVDDEEESLAEFSLTSDGAGQLYMDPEMERKNKGVAAIQSIEVVYDPDFHFGDDEDDGLSRKRSFWSNRRKGKPPRHDSRR